MPELCQWPFSYKLCNYPATEELIVQGGGFIGRLCFDHACELERAMTRTAAAQRGRDPFSSGGKH